MNKTTFSPKQCVYCHAPAQELRYHSRYQTRDGQRTVFRCRLCRKTFNDRFDTAFYDLKTPAEKVARAVQQVAEGLSIEAVARIEAVAPETVSNWVRRAAAQADRIDRERVQNVTAQWVELDEVYSFAGTKQTPETVSDEIGKYWTHCGFVRETRLLLAVKVGLRDEQSAQELVAETAARLAPDCDPLWVSDGWKAYIYALLLKYHLLVHQIRRRGRGRPPGPKMIPHPCLKYAQMIKRREHGRVVGIEQRIIFGAEETIALKEVITSHLERLNGTMRLHCTPLHRKTRCFAKNKRGLEEQVKLFKSYYNFCLKHHSLDYQTPAQAAGLIDRPLSMMDLLNYGVFTFSKIS